MSIVLLILKIIGIALLVILGLLLLIIMFLLFLPVQYRIRGNITEATHIGIKVSWLLGLFHCKIAFEDKEVSCKIRLLGIPIGQKKEKTKRIKKKQKKRKHTSHMEFYVTVTDENDFKESEESELQLQQVVDENVPLDLEEKQESKFKTVFRKIKAFCKKIKSFPGMMKEKWEKLKEKVKNIKDIVVRIKAELKDEANRAAFAVVWKELKYLLKHFSPRKAMADLTFGMEEPSSTGQVLGIISTLPFVYRYNLSICPDFETDSFYLKGNFDVKGHVRCIHILISAIRLLKDKNIHVIISKLRNL